MQFAIGCPLKQWSTLPPTTMAIKKTLAVLRTTVRAYVKVRSCPSYIRRAECIHFGLLRIMGGVLCCTDTDHPAYTNWKDAFGPPRGAGDWGCGWTRG